MKDLNHTTHHAPISPASRTSNTVLPAAGSAQQKPAPLSREGRREMLEKLKNSVHKM
jgi:hypothetical protein